jgi:hypothetical protein
LRDGRILLFHRSDTKGGTWHMRLRIAEVTGYIQQSTNTSSLAEANQIANDKFDSLRNLVKSGLSTKPPTFNEYWHYWFERELATGAWKDHRVRWHKSYFKRYFGKHPLSDITPEIAKG